MLYWYKSTSTDAEGVCALLAVTMLHGFIMVICENILSYQMDRDFKMSRALNGLSSTVGLCASASKPPSFCFFDSHPPVSSVIYAVLPALLACITSFFFSFPPSCLLYYICCASCFTGLHYFTCYICGRFRLTLPLHRALLEALIE